MSSNDDRSVAVVGLGRMGSAFATRLLETGWQVAGFDVDPARVAAMDHPQFRGCAAAADAVADARFVVTSVFDGAQLAAALTAPGGILDGARPGTIVIDASTISPESSATCAQACADRSATLLRATVSGNPQVLLAGKLAMYCSGAEQDFQAAAPVLDAVSAHRVWLGPGEEARYAKLVVNLMVCGTNALLAEALGIAQAAGISQRDFFECVQGSVVGSAFTQYKGDAIQAGDYHPTISAVQVRKDLDYILGAARSLGVAVPTAGIVDQVYGLVTEAGFGDLDFGAATLLHRVVREAWEAGNS